MSSLISPFDDDEEPVKVGPVDEWINQMARIFAPVLLGGDNAKDQRSINSRLGQRFAIPQGTSRSLLSTRNYEILPQIHLNTQFNIRIFIMVHLLF